MSATAVARPSHAYRRAVEELRENPGQWQAYSADGHCVVLAGPGSGKTKTLTVKIAKLLIETIREPRGLACMTYSTECARELVKRLDRMGVYRSDLVFIGTVHSFCLQNVVMPYAALGGMNPPGTCGSRWPANRNLCSLRRFTWKSAPTSGLSPGGRGQTSTGGRTLIGTQSSGKKTKSSERW